MELEYVSIKNACRIVLMSSKLQGRRTQSGRRRRACTEYVVKLFALQDFHCFHENRWIGRCWIRVPVCASFGSGLRVRTESNQFQGMSSKLVLCNSGSRRRALGALQYQPQLKSRPPLGRVSPSPCLSSSHFLLTEAMCTTTLLLYSLFLSVVGHPNCFCN